MSEERNNRSFKDLNEPIDDREQINYQEETSAELANPLPLRETRGERETGARSGIGLLALIFAVLSLFFSPLFFGIIGILLGAIARRKEAGLGLGSWAIGISTISIVISLFFAPLF